MDGEAKTLILVVEDDLSVSRFLCALLESFGFAVHAERSGAAGVAFAAEHHPKLVILDLRLPDLGGYEVCRQLRRLYHPSVLPVLMLTGMDKPIDQLRGFAHGADAYLTKPCDPQELVKTVELLLGETAVH